MSRLKEEEMKKMEVEKQKIQMIMNAKKNYKSKKYKMEGLASNGVLMNMIDESIELSQSSKDLRLKKNLHSVKHFL
eukprot:CAMPEP_0202980046 /NCGR_PEP_ID=MMETSP1396-20130829/86041_1 /ASSEMBLY_ACC=CAM_ASM_000872 /TAXON_ID= /ORGANISM="Pseudokeronopsis sp., Strain Brazil" /LENGTH=75 /DNA_ID=CAMNT_0049719769 /DNA_START=527 /DNA_END=751 /DNA_ORIENTATION=+